MSQEEIRDEVLDADGPSTFVENVAGSGVCYLGDVEIYADKPLPEYDSGEVKAYAASAKNDKKQQFFALICEKHLTPRIKSIETYNSVINPALLNVRACGVVHWPLTKKEHYVFVYKNSLGVPLLEKGKALALSMRQVDVMDNIVRPIVLALKDLRDKGVFHGAIRPDNLYAMTSLGLDKVMLGDCLSSPVSASQPSLYETIERSMSLPLGKGVGTGADDLYALGITISVLMRSRDPLEGLSEDEVIREKVTQGSYAAVTGKDRFTGSILELLRGLLQDDVVQRWGIDEVLAWLDGTRISPKQGISQKKAARPIVVGGEKYTQLSLLSMGLISHPEEAHKLIEEGNLDQWLRRSLDDMESVEKLNAVVDRVNERGRGNIDLLLSSVSCVLDSRAPLRFRELSVMGEAVGSVLAEHMALNKDVKSFNAMFSQGAALNWVNAYEGTGQDVTDLLSKFDNCSNFIKQSKVGYGIERCLYYLNSEGPCLGEKLDDYFVLTPDAFLSACEDMCKKGKAPAFFLDRHSIAFLLVRDAKTVSHSLYDLNSGVDSKRVMGNLRCLASIQKGMKAEKLPAVAATFIDVLPCVYERFHDADIREKIKAKVEKSATKGSLVEMVDILDNVDAINVDREAFRGAMVEYYKLRDEYKALDAALKNKDSFGRKAGGDVTAVFSVLVSAIIILVMVFLYIG